MVIRTHDGPKDHVFPCIYTPYLVLITMFPRRTGPIATLIRTHDGPKSHVFPCVYPPYLVPITMNMFPGNRPDTKTPCHGLRGVATIIGVRSTSIFLRLLSLKGLFCPPPQRLFVLFTATGGHGNQNARWTQKPCISPYCAILFGSDHYVPP